MITLESPAFRNAAWQTGQKIQIAPGAACDVFGPRGSLDLGRVDGPCVLLGDETAFGLAYALGHGPGARGPRCLFEVNVAADARVVQARLGLARAELFARVAGDGHLAPMMRRLAALAQEGTCFVLTGRASTIQRQRRVLKDCGVPGGRILAKAYWAPGKTGLD